VIAGVDVNAHEGERLRLIKSTCVDGSRRRTDKRETGGDHAAVNALAA
jgi:IS5 family transposase